MQYEGKPLRGPDGNGVDFSADGIELSIDGLTLYWQAIRGKTLYSIPTSGLRAGESDQRLATQITTIGENGPADGFWMSPAASTSSLCFLDPRRFSPSEKSVDQHL